MLLYNVPLLAERKEISFIRQDSNLELLISDVFLNNFKSPSDLKQVISNLSEKKSKGIHFLMPKIFAPINSVTSANIVYIRKGQDKLTEYIRLDSMPSTLIQPDFETDYVFGQTPLLFYFNVSKPTLYSKFLKRLMPFKPKNHKVPHMRKLGLYLLSEVNEIIK